MEKDLSLHMRALKENAVDIISEKEIEALLEGAISENRPLVLKAGFDPTASDIHLGHTVLLRKLRKLQDLGHEVVFIIGDFTAKIGDPSGRSSLRPVLSDQEIKENSQTYIEQAFKVLDKKRTRKVFNSQWYKDMDLGDFLRLLSSYTMARIIERDDFSNRIKRNLPLTMLELVYPLIQGYDSVMCRADIEFGGTDQKFNLLVGRHIQENYGCKPQAVVTLPLLTGLDGKQKMSKSLGNYIAVTEGAASMFGKVMSLTDESMLEYFRLLTERDPAEIGKIHPKKAKSMLAEEIVSFYHSASQAKTQSHEFDRVFSKKEIPDEVPVFKTGLDKCDIVEILSGSGVVSSKNEARRLISQGAVYKINPQDCSQEVLTGGFLDIPPEGVVVKVGKKVFRKFIV